MTGGGLRNILGAVATLGLVGALAIAGCSSDDDTAPTSSSGPATTRGEDPTIATTTRVVDTTIAPSTLAPTTMTASTTTSAPAPSTTTLDDLRAEIEADLNEGEQALLRSLEQPGASESIAILDDFFAGRSLTAVQGIHERLEADGLAAMPGTQESFHRVIEVLAYSEGSATIINCRVDGGVLVRRSPTGVETVDDVIVRYVSENSVEFSNGRWLLAGGETLVRTEGSQSCDDIS